VFRRHPLATGIVAGAIAIVIACGLTAWGVGSAVTASLTNQTAPVAAPPTATPAPQANATQGGRVEAGRVAFRATIESIGDSTWTILTKRGQTVNVTITSATLFGTKRASETQGSFSVGDNVVVVATRTNGTATAVRIATAADASAPTASPTSTATT
jgi:hypothetical protein